MDDTATPADALIEAALRVVARQGWQTTTLFSIADEAAIPAATVYAHYATRDAVLVGIIDWANRQALLDREAEPPDPQDTIRDVAFDVVMRRFDVAMPHREALRAIYHGTRRDPRVALKIRAPLFRAVGLMMDEARLERTGVAGAIRMRRFGLIVFATFRAFLDDNDDLADTMATLDKRLRGAEDWIRRAEIPGARGLKPQAAATNGVKPPNGAQPPSGSSGPDEASS
ncbi:MAG: helix-turn-helix domain-containing protein [Pseudomonadota bacterium]